MLNIYLVQKKDGYGFNEYTHCIVICKDEEMARRMHPNGVSILNLKKMEWSHPNEDKQHRFFNMTHSDTWVKPEEYKYLVVTKLGTACDTEKQRVVISGYVGN